MCSQNSPLKTPYTAVDAAAQHSSATTPPTRPSSSNTHSTAMKRSHVPSATTPHVSRAATSWLTIALSRVCVRATGTPMRSSPTLRRWALELAPAASLSSTVMGVVTTSNARFATVCSATPVEKPGRAIQRVSADCTEILSGRSSWCAVSDTSGWSKSVEQEGARDK